MLAIKQYILVLIINLICFKCCMLDNATNFSSRFEQNLLSLNYESMLLLQINAVYQFICGFGAPFSDFQFESLSGVVFKTKYFLPKQVNSLHKQVFRMRMSGRSFRSKIYKVHSTFDIFRWNVYEMLTVWADKFNLDGHMCVLKSLCEAAQEKFALQSGDVWHDIAHILFTPQTSIDQLVYKFEKDFMEAALVGDKHKTNATCHTKYSECTRSILSVFSNILN